MVVIGSANSSNTNALSELAREAGCPEVYRINGPDELPVDFRPSSVSPPVRPHPKILSVR